jgi:translation initiation factor 2D
LADHLAVELFRLKDLYTVPELRTIIDSYVNTHSLVHPREPAFITLDDTLRDLLLEKNEELDFLKREELTPRLRSVMQPWYSMAVNDKEPVVKLSRWNTSTVAWSDIDPHI